MFKTPGEIKVWLDKKGIKSYVINGDLTVDVHSYVDLSNKNLKKMPVQFGIVHGDFYCYGNKLTSLKGCPYEVKGIFHCGNNKLTSLDYCPKIIGHNLNIANNQITSLKDFDSQVFRNIIHSYTDENPFKIIELESYYIKDKFSDNKTLMFIQMAGEEIHKILNYFKLNNEIPIKENRVQNKVKI